MFQWQIENGRWAARYWWWDAECWAEGVKFLEEQRKGLPKDAETRIALWPGLTEDGIETWWLCLRWRVEGSPWQDTEGFDMSHTCPPIC